MILTKIEEIYFISSEFILVPVSDDYNRVVLEPDGDGYDEGDYINASYVDVRATALMPIFTQYM